MIKTTINLTGIELFANHGWYEFERKKGGKFRVDVWVTVNIDESNDLDDIRHTINYEQVYNLVKTEMEIPSKLIEHVCFRILKKLESDFSQVLSCKVSVSKLNPPINGSVANSSVTMEV